LKNSSVDSSREIKRKSTKKNELSGKQEIAQVVTDPMKYKPAVIHKARKVESFIEKTEPRLVQQLDSWS
jgi:hypothetical protein